MTNSVMKSVLQCVSHADVTINGDFSAGDLARSLGWNNRRFDDLGNGIYGGTLDGYRDGPEIEAILDLCVSPSGGYRAVSSPEMGVTFLFNGDMGSITLYWREDHLCSIGLPGNALPDGDPYCTLTVDADGKKIGIYSGDDAPSLDVVTEANVRILDAPRLICSIDFSNSIAQILSLPSAALDFGAWNAVAESELLAILADTLALPMEDIEKGLASYSYSLAFSLGDSRDEEAGYLAAWAHRILSL